MTSDFDGSRRYLPVTNEDDRYTAVEQQAAAAAAADVTRTQDTLSAHQ
jgi:hypothetical protein